MAHYIAELITESKKANAKDRPLIQKKCFDTILTLWQHRNVMPDGKRPFENLELIAQVIESLNPDENNIHYFHSVRSSMVSDEENPEIKEWINIIDAIDYSAKVMIEDCLARMSNCNIDKSKEWVKLAEATKISHAPAEKFIQFISPDGGRVKTHHNLTDRLKRFEKSIEIANTFATNIRQQINELSHESEKDNTSKISKKKKRVTEKKKAITKKKSTPKKRVTANKKTATKKKIGAKEKPVKGKKSV